MGHPGCSATGGAHLLPAVEGAAGGALHYCDMPLSAAFRGFAAAALIATAAASLGCSASQAEDHTPAGFGPAGVTAAAYAGSRPNAPDGLYLAETCNGTLRTCHLLEVEVRGGYVETIFLASGGHLEIDGAKLGEDGSASGDAYRMDEGYTGDVWSVRIQEHGYAGS